MQDLESLFADASCPLTSLHELRGKPAHQLRSRARSSIPTSPRSSTPTSPPAITSPLTSHLSPACFPSPSPFHPSLYAHRPEHTPFTLLLSCTSLSAPVKCKSYVQSSQVPAATSSERRYANRLFLVSVQTLYRRQNATHVAL